jgi:hypothetical protein
MNEEWTELMHEVGRVVEASGRMLQRKPPFTKQDLTDLHDTLTHASLTIQIAQDNIFTK